MSNHSESDETQPPSDYDEPDVVDEQAIVVIECGKTKSKRKGRGRGCGKPNFGVNGLEQLSFDEQHKPVGKNACRFARFVASLVREPNALPLHVRDWRIMKKFHGERIEALWKRIVGRIALTSEQEARLNHIFENVLTMLHKALQNFKQKLRKFYLKMGGYNNLRRFELPFNSIDPTNWRRLVEYWESSNFKEVSRKNKRIAKEQTMHSTTGSRSYAQGRHLFAKKNMRKPDDFEFFKIVHIIKKTGQWVDTNAKEASERIQAKIDELPTELQNDPESRNKIFREEFKRRYEKDTSSRPRRSIFDDGVNFLSREQVEREKQAMNEAFETREQDLLTRIKQLEDEKIVSEASINAKVEVAIQVRQAEFINSFQQHFGHRPSQTSFASFTDTNI